MIRMSVLYPETEGATFDHDYYRDTHVPLAVKTWSPERTEIDKGVSGPYVAAVHFMFGSTDEMNAALGALIARLRVHLPDVVGLSEMWTEDDRERVTNELRDLYPNFVEGPHDPIDLVVTDAELMGGGLLLLSRHRIVASGSTVAATPAIQV